MMPSPIGLMPSRSRDIAVVFVHEDIVGLAAECEHDCKNHCDCNGNDSEA